jgi:capsular exopolysaccharide synthesis family protein
MRAALPESDTPILDTPPSHSVWNLLKIAWLRKWLVALGLILGVIGGSLYYAEQPEVYASRAQLLVVKKNSDALPIASADARFDFDDYLTTHIALIKSPLIVGRAVKKRDLGSLPAFTGRGDPTPAIIGSLTVSRDTSDSKEASSKILNLSFRSSSAESCRVVLEAVIESYRESLEESYRDVGSETVGLITRARDMLQKDLKKKETEYWDFRQKTPLVLNGKDRINIHQNRLAGIEAKRSALQVRQAELKGQLAALESALKEGLSAASKSALLAQLSRSTADGGSMTASASLKDQLVGLLLQEQNLQDVYGPDHPQVEAIHRKIAVVRGLMEPSARNPVLRSDGSLEQYAEALKQELHDNEVTAQSLKELFEQENAEAKKLTNYEMREEMLRTDVARTQELYNTILRRLQEVNLLKEAGGYNTQILWPPSEGGKMGPRLLSIVPMTALLGLLAGFGLAYFMDRSDTRFRTPEEIHQRLGVPVIGHIPVLPDVAITDEEGASGSDLHPILYSHFRSRSVEAEAYRGVRTALYFMTFKEGRRLIQITSPNGADGKTTLAANLAISIAQAGMKCLILDADFRKPKIHTLFGVPNEVGLTSVLTGGADLEETIAPCAVPGLSVLPCGPLPHNPAEVLMAPQFGDVLSVLRQIYDYVLIDSPPLLAVTDPGVIAPRVDGVLFVLRPGNDNRAAVLRAKDILAGLGGKLLGVVVNGIGPRDRNTQYNYAPYGDGHNYGYTGYYQS